MSLGELRAYVRLCLREAFDKDLFDDPKVNDKSVLVPDDIKKKIKRWLKHMKMTKR